MPAEIPRVSSAAMTAAAPAMETSATTAMEVAAHAVEPSPAPRTGVETIPAAPASK